MGRRSGDTALCLLLLLSLSLIASAALAEGPPKRRLGPRAPSGGARRQNTNPRPGSTPPPHGQGGSGSDRDEDKDKRPNDDDKDKKEGDGDMPPPQEGEGGDKPPGDGKPSDDDREDSDGPPPPGEGGSGDWSDEDYWEAGTEFDDDEDLWSDPPPPPVLGTPVPTEDSSVVQTPFFVEFDMEISIATTLSLDDWRAVLVDSFDHPQQYVQVNTVDLLTRRQASATLVTGTLFANDRVSAVALSNRVIDEGGDLVEQSLLQRGVTAVVEFPETVETVTQAEGGVTPQPAPVGGVGEGVQQTDYFVDFEISASASGIEGLETEDWRVVFAEAMSLPEASVQVNTISSRRQSSTSTVGGTLFAQGNDAALSLGTKMRNQGKSLIQRALNSEAGLSFPEVSVLSAAAKTTTILESPGAAPPSFNYALLGILGVLVVPLLLLYMRQRSRAAAQKKQQSAANVDAYLSSQVVIPVSAPQNLNAQLSQQRPPPANPSVGKPYKSAAGPQAAVLPTAPDFPQYANRGGGGGVRPDPPPPSAHPPRQGPSAVLGVGRRSSGSLCMVAQVHGASAVYLPAVLSEWCGSLVRR